MTARQNTSENLISYWQPDLVREAGEVAIKLPRNQMEKIMVQATEFMEKLPWKGEKVMPPFLVGIISRLVFKRHVSCAAQVFGRGLFRLSPC